MNEYGKIPPQAVDLEGIVLGTILLDREAMLKAIGIITMDTFYKNGHGAIFNAMQTLFNDNEPIDTMTVFNRLKTQGRIDEAGGLMYIVKLTDGVSSTAHIESHCRILQQKFIQREIIRISAESMKNAYNDEIDVFQLLEGVYSDIMKISNTLTGKTSSMLYDVSQKLATKILELADSTDELTGVPCGITDLDRFTGGWQSPDLVIVAARPGMGKTAFSLAVAKGAAQFGRAVAFFSLEMSEEQLAGRLISDELNINSDRIRTPTRLDSTDKNALINELHRLNIPIYIDDTAGLSITQLRAKTTALKKKHNIEMIIVDYLQLMTGISNGGNRDTIIGEITRGLKLVAKELKIPVIALSQLSRKVEERADKRPMLSDLRESGNIEQDADAVIFLYRPEYYNVESYEDGRSTKNVCEIIFGKHRNGGLGTIEQGFDGAHSRFYSLDTFEPRPLSKINRPNEDDFNVF
jgi:replicative DNA helicase